MLACDGALIDKATATKSESTTTKCPFTVEQTDEDKDGNCPPLEGEDEVGFTTTETGSETDSTGSTDDAGPSIPDLPKQP